MARVWWGVERYSFADAFVIPKPSFWIVKIEGVGDVCEYPKKGRCFVDVHIESVVRRSPIGLGEVVARNERK